ncbi:hypothetical protein Bca4012_026784 [Brassica carinata]
MHVKRSTDEEGNPRISKKKEAGSDHQFEFDLDDFGGSKVRIVEPKFRLSFAELLDESRVVPISVYGDLDVEITGIQHDSRGVCAGDLFVCCENDGDSVLSEADKRGAVAVVASKKIDIEDTLGCRVLVIVEDTEAILAALASSFYRDPSKNMARKITHQSSSEKRLYLDDDDDEGLGDDEIESFLQSRNKRGRGSVGRRMDETGPYLPTEKVIQLQSSDTRERKVVLLQLGL